MEMTSKRKRKGVQFALTAIASVAAVMCFEGAAYAQDAAATAGASADQTTEPAEIIITGSRIRQVQKEGPTPVTIITRDDIDKAGYQSVTDVLEGMSQNTGGSFNTSTSFSFGAGAQTVDLKGFGSNRTLILIDGRRQAIDPVFLSQTNQSVDLSTIPLAMVDRIEVLTDGASAIYGSDAIGGVINIITKKSINGGMLSVRGGTTQHGGHDNGEIQFGAGVANDKMSLNVAASYNKSNRLMFTDRKYSESDATNGGTFSGYGSNFVDPSGALLASDPDCGTGNAGDSTAGAGVIVGTRCRFDRAKYREWYPDSERGSVTVWGDRTLPFLDATAFGRFTYVKEQQAFRLEPFPYGGGETSNGVIPDSEFPDGRGLIPAGSPGNPTTGTGDEQDGYFNRRLVEFGGRGSDVSSQNYNGVLGVRGRLDDYDWEAAVSQSHASVYTRTRGNFISSVLDYLVLSRGLNLFDPIPQDVVDEAGYTPTSLGVSNNTGIDATVSGPLHIDLPGGPIQAALHWDYNHEDFSSRNDKLSVFGDTPDGAAPDAAGSRSYYGLAFELQLPIINSLELGLAGRYDDYNINSVGGQFSPKVSLAYRPLETVLVRASYGNTFRAPDLVALYAGQSSGFETVVDTRACRASGHNPGDDVPECADIQSVPVVNGSNPDLKSEKGWNWNVGVSWEIVKDLTVSVDHYTISLNNIVEVLTAQQVVDSCANEGLLCDQITDSVSHPGSPSGLGNAVGGYSDAQISAGAANFASQRLKGTDTKIDYRINTGVGKFTNTLTWTWLQSLKVKIDPSAPAEEQLNYGGSVTVPRHRLSLVNDWSYSAYGAYVKTNFIGKLPGALPNETSGPIASDEFYPSFLTIDLQLRYTLPASLGMVRLGIDNILDRDFPLDPTEKVGGSNTANEFITGAGPSYFSPLGRAYYLQYEVTF
ncbi:TonB-dependent receptor [Solimonas terrae]|uniref:TonB-dependent receptor n=1 Tax=Solimonas terrae TaxID=1396819 RepID=A0A6M2BX19_9GAMM|nr:TonB-dependent receptor [Solimonas terrae]NGY06924.1 TonB-dependent receptor [Solimonas terrae]